MPLINQIENIVRAVVIKDKRILLCRAVETGHYFLPGGHIEFGDDAITALNREVMEELGTTVLNPVFIGCMENFYGDASSRHHEYCIIFQCELEDPQIKSKETHLEFVWATREELETLKFLPPHFKQNLIKWLEDREVFFSRP